MEAAKPGIDVAGKPPASLSTLAIKFDVSHTTAPHLSKQFQLQLEDGNDAPLLGVQ